MVEATETAEANRTESGTTIVGLAADGGVVVASDRRASLDGMVSSKRAEKVFGVGDRAGLAFTGAVSGAQALVARLEREVRLTNSGAAGGCRSTRSRCSRGP